jgi:hypothetical protein
VTGTTTATNLEILSDLTNETLEWEFTDEELRRFLIPTNLTKSDGTRAEPVWLLHATSCSLNGLNQPSARDHNCDDDDDDADVDDAKSYTYGGGSLTSGFGCELLTGGLA